MFEFPVKQFRVIDGDSQDILCDCGFHIMYRCTTRLIGIDAPERNTAAGKLVTSLVANWMTIRAAKLLWFSHELDKYGRSLGDFAVIGDSGHCETLTGYLRDKQVVREYEGGHREPWTEAELTAIEQRVRGGN